MNKTAMLTLLAVQLFVSSVFFALGVPSLSQAQCLYTEPATPYCSSPRVIPGTVGQHVVLMDVSTSASTATLSCSSYLTGHVVYFQVTPTVTGYVTVSTCHPMTMYDTVLDVFSGSGCELFTQIACNDDSTDAYCDSSCSGRPSKVRFWATAGSTYRIRVGSYNQNSGGCSLCLGLIVTIGEPCGDPDTKPPRNIVCSEAYELPGTPGVHEMTVDATDAPANPQSWSCASANRPVWFKFTPTYGGTVTFSTCHPTTSYDTVINAVSACSGPFIYTYGCNDDMSGCGTKSQLSFSVNPGGTYYVAVGAYGSSGSAGCLGVYLTLPEPECTTNPECDDGNPCTTDTCSANRCQYTNVASGQTCTDDGNPCTSDICNGAGACTHPNAPDGTSCGDSADTACTDPDTCQSGTCVPNHAGYGSLCTDDGNQCTDDICNGSGGCIHPNKSYGAACGDPTNTVCNPADFCNGSGTCLSTYSPSGTACLEDGNDCTWDYCNGSGACTHPNKASGSACGSSADTDCDNPDTCNGAGVCLANLEPIGVICTDDGNDCTLDQCNGSGGCGHPFKELGAACGDPSDTACTDPDTCNGSGVCLANHATAGSPCPNGLFCDGEEVCNGTGGCLEGAFPCGDEEICNEETDICENEFLEEFPAWRTPDPAVTSLTVDPERVQPGDEVTFHAVLANMGTAPTGAFSLVFRVDDSEVARRDFDSLGSSEQVQTSATWIAVGPGRHPVVAMLEFGDGTEFDGSLENNRRGELVRIAGEDPPKTELIFPEIDFDALEKIPYEPFTVDLKVRNPGFAAVQNVPLTVVKRCDEETGCPGDVDDEGDSDGMDLALLQADFGATGCAGDCPGDINGDDAVDGADLTLFLPGFGHSGIIVEQQAIDDLEPGEETVIQAHWDDLTPGRKLVSVKLDLPDNHVDDLKELVWSWTIPFGDIVQICTPAQKHQWSSMGPRILTNGSAGRIHAIAFHPTDQNTLFASTPRGGIWKSTDRGGSWFPQGDKLETLGGSSVAVDPQHPQIVYYATGFVPYGGGIGIYKSINGGNSWHLFANKQVAGGVNRLEIRYPSPTQLMIYAATDKGVKRYKSTNPWATACTASEWATIKTGQILDMVVHPTNHNLVYAAVMNGMVQRTNPDLTVKNVRVMQGVFRTTAGETAVGDADWSLLANGLPTSASTSTKIDICKGNPNVLYACCATPYGEDPIEPMLKMGIFRTMDGGDSWSLVRGYFSYDVPGFYNPFIRVHPLDSNIVYYGGVNLFKEDISATVWKPEKVTGIHADQHTLEFDPFDSTRYYVGNDGGLWRCTVNVSGDSCIHRNYELRNVELYDVDASQTNSNLMIGGTQDNGTILYEGNLDWREVRAGDGYHSLIAPTNDQIMYSQHQFFDSTMRSPDGGTKWYGAATGLPDGYCSSAWITSHPNSADYLLAQGDQVYFSNNGGLQWNPVGPFGSNVKGTITRVVVQPTTFDWIAGNSKGQIWYTPYGGSPWYLLFEHPFGASVVRLAFAPTDYKVLYAIFSIGGSKSYTRIWQFTLNPGPPESWSPSNITDNFPANCQPLVISGDGYRSDIAYVGTSTAGVFRWDGTKATYESWQPYNQCLPYARINDLLVDPSSKELRAATQGRGAWTVVTGP